MCSTKYPIGNFESKDLRLHGGFGVDAGRLPGHHSIRPPLILKWHRHTFIWCTLGDTVGRLQKSVKTAQHGLRCGLSESEIGTSASSGTTQAYPFPYLGVDHDDQFVSLQRAGIGAVLAHDNDQVEIRPADFPRQAGDMPPHQPHPMIPRNGSLSARPHDDIAMMARMPCRHVSRSIRLQLVPRSCAGETAWTCGLPYRPPLSRWTRLIAATSSTLAVERALRSRER